MNCTSNSNTRILHHISLSPACRKIRLMLYEKNLPYELHTENIWPPRKELYELNPAGTVPVLLDINGEIICGSYPIAEYLEEQYPHTPLFGNDLHSKNEIRRLVDWFDGEFNTAITQKILFEKIYKRKNNGGSPNSSVIRKAKAEIGYHLEYIIYLTTNQKWLAGNFLTAADITAGAHISTLDYLGDIPWRDYPQAKQWYAILKSQPSFQKILQDKIAGIVPPPYYDNPDF